MPRPPSAGRVTSAFGPRPKPTPTSPAFHYGEDTIGAGNYAPVSGRVIQAGYVGAYGNRIIIDAGNGIHWWVCHNARIDVKVGDLVTEGQWIGLMGATGNVTGVHAHTERRIGATTPGSGTASNPRDAYVTPAGGPGSPIAISINQQEDEMKFYVITNKGGLNGVRVMLRPDGFSVFDAPYWAGEMAQRYGQNVEEIEQGIFEDECRRLRVPVEKIAQIAVAGKGGSWSRAEEPLELTDEQIDALADRLLAKIEPPAISAAIIDEIAHATRKLIVAPEK